MTHDATLPEAAGFLAKKRGWLQLTLTDDLDRLIQPIALEENKLPGMMRCSIAILAGATICFVIWSAVTPVKELARTDGQVVPSGYNQIVQHLDGGLVSDILVHEGEFVQKNQVLMHIAGAGSEEDLHEQKVLVTALELQAERLHAGLEQRQPDFSKFDTTPEQVAEQGRMFTSTDRTRTNEGKVLDEQIAQKQSILARLETEVKTASANFEIAHEARQIYEKLHHDGLTTRTNYLNKVAEYNTRSGEVMSMTQRIEGARKELQEYQQRREALTSQQRDTSYNNLDEVTTKLAQERSELQKRLDRVGRLAIRAPVMGYIKGVKVNTIGAVIPAGQTLMEIVPVDAQLTVEIRIMPQQIGRVAVGKDVQVRVNSYDYIRFGTIPGKLEYISPTTFVDEGRQEEYYKGRVKLDRSYVGSVPGMHAIIPGMTVEANIITGEKSVLGYLMRPIRNAFANSLTEQ